MLSGFVARLAEVEQRRREERLEAVRRAVLAAYEPADPVMCVRRLEVTVEVGRALGRVVSNRLHDDVRRAAAAIGFERIKYNGRALYRCAKRRDHTDEQALAQSRANRYDPRWSK